MSTKDDSVYFYLKQGKVTGPVTFNDIVDLMEKGDLTPIELIYEDGEKKWKSLAEFSEFEGAIGNQPSSSIAKEVEEIREPVVEKVEPEQFGEWVVLRKKPGFSNQYEQIGPFAKEVVYKMIGKGEIGFRDFVWTDGYDDWVLLSKDGNFKDRVSLPREVLDLPKPPKTSREVQAAEVEIEEIEPEVTDNDVEKIIEDSFVKENLLKKANQPPEEAEGADLVNPTDGPVEREVKETKKSVLKGSSPYFKERGQESKKQKKSSAKKLKSKDESKEYKGNQKARIKKEVVKETSEELAERKNLPPIPSQPPAWKRVAFIAGNLFLITMVVGFFVFTAFSSSISLYIKKMDDSSQFKEKLMSWFDLEEIVETVSAEIPSLPAEEKLAQQPRPQGKATPPIQTKVAKKVEVVLKPKKATPPPPEKKIKPSYLKVRTEGLSGSSAKLKFVSDGSSHYQVKVDVFAEPGETLYDGVYSRTFRVQKDSKGRRELMLKNLKIRDGKYSFTAKLGNKVVSDSFFLGKNDRSFRDQRALVRKRLSPSHQTEKIGLIRESENLLTTSNQMMKGLVGTKKSKVRQELSRIQRRLRSRSARKSTSLWPESWQSLAAISQDLKKVELDSRGDKKLSAKDQKEIKGLISKLKKEKNAIVKKRLF